MRLAVLRAVDERPPGRLHEGRELLDRRLPELRRGVADEVLPELAGVLGGCVRRGRRRQVHEVLDEAERLQPTVPRRLGREHDAMASSPEDVADADAVVRGAVRRLGHEQDGQRLGHHLLVAEQATGTGVQSYATDERLLDELRGGGSDGELVGAIRLTDRLGVALAAEADGAFAVLPLARDGVGNSWRPAAPGDGLSAFVAGVPMASERAIEVDQTNASVVVGERAIVKWFRRVGPAASRATLLLAHLDAVGFREIPPPLGSISWRSPAGAELTIAQGDTFLPGARDGWAWAVDRLEKHVGHGAAPCPQECDPWIGDQLGRLVARLHAALCVSSPQIRRPVMPTPLRTVARWRTAAAATLADALRLTTAQDPDGGALLARLRPAMQAELDGAPQFGAGPSQPVHGDLHVGQVLEWSRGLAVIDFDGNPALHDRANPLRQRVERDVAQMVSSLDHVGRVVEHRHGGVANQAVDAWIARTRHEFLAALETPPNPGLLAAFEVEQECRELVYAARFLPSWRYTPLATLRARYGR